MNWHSQDPTNDGIEYMITINLINLKQQSTMKQDQAESLSFRRVDKEVREKYLELFKDGHSPASAMYVHEDELHLSTTNDQELIEKYRDNELGGRNGGSMFQRLTEIVNDFNNSGRGKAILQEYNADVGKSFILCIVTGLMCRVHGKVRQTGELCYMDASSSFEFFNNLITLLYTSCTIGALPLAL
ncbi:hypothetical protein RhiirB3_428916 [Rhizophagus irregularis]|nr:hypothetical protein RhiirB3_428916 [Rhizophagus irregularis]